jgi:lincosamide nucleotidyltransferase A/C/D/E
MMARRLERSGAGCALRSRVVARVRRRLLVVGSADVVDVLRVLDAAGVPAWLAGGWGVDALLGKQTRAHHDVDVIVRATDASVSRSLRALASIGLGEVVAGAVRGYSLPTPIRLRDDRGRTIDLIPADLSTLPFAAVDGGGVTRDSEGVSRLFAVGTVDGRPVPCLSVGAQLALHHGFDLEPHQRRDLSALCQRFGLLHPAWTVLRGIRGDEAMTAGRR